MDRSRCCCSNFPISVLKPGPGAMMFDSEAVCRTEARREAERKMCRARVREEGMTFVIVLFWGVR